MAVTGMNVSIVQAEQCQVGELRMMCIRQVLDSVSFHVSLIERLIMTKQQIFIQLAIIFYSSDPKQFLKSSTLDCIRKHHNCTCPQH